MPPKDDPSAGHFGGMARSRPSAVAERGSVRLAELVATMSLTTDLGRGEPMEHCLRQTVIAPRIADRLGL